MNIKPHPQSIDGVAQRNGVCRATIYNEIQRGNLKRTKIGSRSIIQPKHEAEWLDVCAEESSQSDLDKLRA
jgi:hypothetical protein